MVAPIFICYRRDDSGSTAGRVRDAIAHTFGDRAVFFDHSSIEPGVKWPAKLEEGLKHASIVISIIGPNWLRSSDKWGRRRIDEPDDWVRKEIETALLNKKLLLPVLVAGASLPPRDKIPDSLAPFLDHQVVELRDAFWQHDIQLVLERIKSVLTPDQLKSVKRGPYPTPPPDKPMPIPESQLEKALNGTLRHWVVTSSTLPEDPSLTRTELFREYEFRSFREAVKFMYQLAPGCDISIHHPRWENIFRTVRVYLSTWDIGHQISDRDVQLAKYFEKSFNDFPGNRKID